MRIACVCLLVSVSLCLAKDDKKDDKTSKEEDVPNDVITFDAKYHVPCSEYQLAGEKIRFEDSRTSTIEQVDNRPGCYSIKGYVDIFANITANLQVVVRPGLHFLISVYTG